MTPDEFRVVVTKIRPYTNYIYLHVLGEPLLHPELDELLAIAEAAELNINITTNGGLLEQKTDLLLKHNIRQLNISLHDAEENVKPEKWDDYLQTALNATKQVACKSYVCLRLWNTSNASSQPFNTLCQTKIADFFNLPFDQLTKATTGNGLKLAEHIFLQRAPRFEWPNENRPGTQTQKNCYALRDHIAILADGQVVPCCLDADAIMKLGNIFTEELSDILTTPKAAEIKKGFEQRRIVELLCASCGFIVD